MRRREFITALTGATVAWPIAAHAQQSSTTKRIAIATPSASPADMSGGDPVFSSFFDESKRLGYIEGKNLTVSRYSGGGQRERYGDLAREIVATNPDVIYSMGMPVTRALKAATNTIPIVALTGNPVPFGLVSSLAHPGGNITGVSVDAGLEIWGKRLELLIEAVPKLANVAYVATQAAWENAGSKAIREVAEKLGASLRHARLGTPINEAEYNRVFGSMQNDGVHGIIIADEVEHYFNRFLLVRLIQEARVPAIYNYRDQVEAGGLMAYSHEVKGPARMNATQVVEILHGKRPSDMPYIQEAKFEVLINLKTAKALGLTVPPSLLARGLMR